MRVLIASLVIGGLGQPLLARAAPDSECLPGERRIEAALLNRRINADGLIQLQPATAGWQKLALPAAEVTVLNLWSRSCKACLEELPVLGQVMKQHLGTPFFFIADPPTETSREEIASLWAQPIIELPKGHACRLPIGEPPARGGASACRLFLPATLPARSEDGRLMESLGQAAVRPITILVDRSGVVRQAFVGSLLTRVDELNLAIRRLRELPAPGATIHPRHKGSAATLILH